MFSRDPLWTLDYTDYHPDREKHAEAICATGNGYLGCRGAFAETSSGERHYPGTYIAGLYNRLVSKVADRDLENEDFVNCPDWTLITVETPGGARAHPDTDEIRFFRRQLSLRDGLLHRDIRLKHPTGEITRIRSTRFVSMADAHLAGIRYTVTPENYSGPITFISGLNGDIKNDGVARYSQLNQLHLGPDREEADGADLLLGVKTVQSEITVVEKAAHTLWQNGKSVLPRVDTKDRPRFIETRLTVDVTAGEDVTLDKTVAIHTSRDDGSDDPYSAADSTLAARESLTEAMDRHRAAWERVWERADVVLEGDDRTQRVIRLHTYHLMVTASRHNTAIDASVPARGLHGEAYRGHIFWDELFIFPFYNMHYPDVARSFLMYRYRRLNKARDYAREHGYAGAMFPWQSGSDGREETQIVHLNPVSGEWGPDFSSLQRHISLAVAYNTWTYCHVTGDDDFLRDYAAEMILDIAAFWASKCSYNETSGRYEIHHVMGPNEFHETMPGQEEGEGGLKDNAYTNVMTAWLLEQAADIYRQLPSEYAGALLRKLSLNEETLETWRDIARRLHVAVREGIIAQYDGFLDLKELDWDHYRREYDNIGRLDRILKAEGLNPDDYQLSKQGDLTMLFYVLPLDVLQSVFEKLGVSFTDETLRQNYDYYLQRTSHGSTLSLIVHSRVAALLGDLDTSLEWYRKSLEADINDIQGGTTPEGIHTGLMAGTVTGLLASYGGLDLWHDQVLFDPKLPPDWTRLRFNFTFRDVRYYADLTPDTLSLNTAAETTADVSVRVRGADYTLPPGKTVSIRL